MKDYGNRKYVYIKIKKLERCLLDTDSDISIIDDSSVSLMAYQPLLVI